MVRAMVAMLICALSIACTSDAEKLPLPPLPQDGATLPFTQVLDRLAAQTNTAKDAHFLNQWDALVDVSVQLEQSAGYLLRAPDLPPLHRLRIERDTAAIQASIQKLRTSARAKDQVESLEQIRLLHNRIHELRELK